MPHFSPLLGGRLAELLQLKGGEIVRQIGDRVFIRHPVTGHDRSMNVLYLHPQEKVAKLCRKYGITAEEFQELLKEVMRRD